MSDSIPIGPFVPNEALINDLSESRPFFKQAMDLPLPSGIEKELKSQKEHKEKVRETLKKLENVGRIGAGITVGVAAASTALLATAATVVGIGLAAGFIASNPVGWGIGGALGGAALLGATIGVGAGIIALLCKGHIWHDVVKPALIGLAVAVAVAIVVAVIAAIVAIISAGKDGGGGIDFNWPRFHHHGFQHGYGQGVLAGMGAAILLNELTQAPLTLPDFNINPIFKETGGKKEPVEKTEGIEDLTNEESRVMVLDKNTPPEQLQESFNTFIGHIETGLSEKNITPGTKDYSAIEEIYKRSVQLVKNKKYDEALNLLRWETHVEQQQDAALSIDIARLAMLQKKPQNLRADALAQIEAMRHSNDPILALNLAKCLYKIEGFKEHAQSIVALQAMMIGKREPPNQQFIVEANEWLKAINYKATVQEA